MDDQPTPNPPEAELATGGFTAVDAFLHAEVAALASKVGRGYVWVAFAG